MCTGVCADPWARYWPTTCQTTSSCQGYYYYFIIILLILEVVKNTPRIFFDFALNIFHFKPKIVIIKEFYVVNKVLNKIERFHTFKKSYDCPWIRFGG